MQRYKKIYARDSPKEFVPVFQIQNNFKPKKTKNKTADKKNIIADMSKIKKQRNTTKGNSTKPSVLSNKREKKTANFARSLTLNKAPINFINIHFKKKNSNINEQTNAISDISINFLNFEITSVTFITINEKVSKPTLSVKAFSSRKY